MSNPAENLVGLTLEGGWKVVEKLPPFPDRTEATFSVGYVVRDAKGREAFCKALDYSSAGAADDPADELKRLADAYVFERSVLDACRQGRMNRVVHSLGSGKVLAPGDGLPTVNYILFERADGDGRDVLDAVDPGNLSVAIALTRDCAAALGQLHRGGVMHQDVKPANLLGWHGTSGPAWVSKLADLGRAFCDSLTGPFADHPCPGDTNWAPPELLYGWPEAQPRTKRHRELADMYSLGSMFCFALTHAVPHSGLLLLHLNQEHRWGSWQGGYESAVPLLIDAHEHGVARLCGAVESKAQADVAALVGDMCHPDFRQRGRLARRNGFASSFLLERYISKLDLLAKRYPMPRDLLTQP